MGILGHKSMPMFRTLLLLIPCLFLGCTQSPDPVPPAPFGLDTRETPALQFENLRLVPIVAETRFLQDQKDIGPLIGLDQALQIPRFRITEKKPYGRFQDAEAVNRLTVQNKTDQAVILLAGEVVRGGKQDRIIAEDRVIAPRSITDVAVFCVAEDRWAYRSEEKENDLSSGSEESVFAFRGYSQMASREVRLAATRQKDQRLVWEQVAVVHAQNKVTGTSKSYAALEKEKSFQETRDRYQKFFQDKWAAREGMVGFVAISGNRILGLELMGNPELFQQQYPALLAGYITDAITNGFPPDLNPEKVQAYADERDRLFHKGKKLEWQGKLIYYHDL